MWRRKRGLWSLLCSLLLAFTALSLVACSSATNSARAIRGGNTEIPAQPLWSSAASMHMALEWLIANQQPNGAFGSPASSRPNEIWLDGMASHRAFQGATTALCAMALIEPARSDARAKATLDLAVQWMIDEEPIGAASGGTFYDTWAHTYLIDCGVRLLREPNRADQSNAIRMMVQREIDFSLRRQSIDGGWGYYDFQGTFERPTGNETTSFNTGAMILALRAARDAGLRVDSVRLDRAVKRLELFRLPDGAFVYGTYAKYRPGVGFNRPSGTSGRLQVCHLALFESHAGGVEQRELVEGLCHLRDRHHYIEIGRGRPIPHEAFYSTSGYYYFFGHYYASGVIEQLTDATERTAFRDWLDQNMRRVQHPNGSWFDYPLYGYGHAYATGFGLLTMQRLASMDPAGTLPK
ncbi:MAG: terpene cyclase/mutase family protein [Planctomycetota bacterium]|nr:terpene cyclase/mutase family protein [Planctomycetota bacterium]